MILLMHQLKPMSLPCRWQLRHPQPWPGPHGALGGRGGIILPLPLGSPSCSSSLYLFLHKLGSQPQTKKAFAQLLYVPLEHIDLLNQFFIAIKFKTLH